MYHFDPTWHFNRYMRNSFLSIVNYKFQNTPLIVTCDFINEALLLLQKKKGDKLNTTKKSDIY
jgi:hypothetical protein